MKPKDFRRRAKQGFSRAIQTVWPRMSQSGVRFLVYHSLVVDDRPDPEQMTTPVTLFEEQMAFLSSNGYEVERAASVVERMRGGELLPKTVVLTFDDGLMDNFSLALPILRKYQFPATIFLIAAALNGRDDLVHHAAGAKYLIWEQVHEMQASGLIDFGCHSATHRNLYNLTGPALQEEVEGGKRQLEDRLGRAIELFAYPFGSYGSWNGAVRSVVERAGFLGAVTTVFGLNTASSDRFLLRRSRISWCERIPEFQSLLQGAYDWYAFVQRLQSPMARRSGSFL